MLLTYILREGLIVISRLSTSLSFCFPLWIMLMFKVSLLFCGLSYHSDLDHCTGFSPKNLAISKCSLSYSQRLSSKLTIVYSQYLIDYTYINLFLPKPNSSLFHTLLIKMEEESSSQVVDLVNKFKKATLDLGDSTKIVICQQDNDINDEEDNKWEATAIGKVIIEGRMNYQTMEKWIGFTWPFITQEDMKIIELEPNIMLFKFNKWDLINTVINERPWSVNNHLLVVHEYIPGMVYTEKHWGFQQFWIQLKYLLPEHMNVFSVTKIGEVMGEVIGIESKDVIPNGNIPVKVCVNVDLSMPLRRGVKYVTNSGVSRWQKFFFERQPRAICTECYVINHNKGACKDAAEYFLKAHEKPYFFWESYQCQENYYF